MKARTFILLCLCAALTLGTGCKRRPLKELDSNVLVRITYDRDIVNYDMTSDPALMRVIFYNSTTGSFAAQAFTPSEGAYVSVLPDNDYHVLAYNFDTENTVITSESEHSYIYATTNNVPESYRSRLRTRATEDPEEDIVFEPDHLFTGNVRDVHIVSRAVDAPVMVIDIEAKTIVQTWILEVDHVQGVEYVGSVAGVISGLASSTGLASRDNHNDIVSVFYEPSEISADGVMTGKFNTFGRNPDYPQIVTIVFTDIAGKGHRLDVDVSDQFIDNPEQIIRIKSDDIIIERPGDSDTGGGGLAPEVGEWDDIEIDIII